MHFSIIEYLSNLQRLFYVLRKSENYAQKASKGNF